jgi:2-amino-4-hydroxy-6-hydroxymethyldihydropteridine diphosphokinase
MARVARLLDDWAAAASLPSETRLRWRAAGFLHDCLRDADPADLREAVSPEDRGLPDKILHGPATALKLREEGVDDEPLLLAVSFHTLGHPELDVLGLALYSADFLEPGREAAAEWEHLRRRMPGDTVGVAWEVARRKVAALLERGAPLREETVAFWNGLVSQLGREAGEG